MSFLNSIKELLGGAAGDVIGGLPGLDGIAEKVTSVTDTVTSVTDGATEAIEPVVEQGQTAVDDIKQNLGL